jgi:ATP synthase protein I
MKKRDERPLHKPEHEVSAEVGKKAIRRQRAIEQGSWSVWFGLGMFGIIGWSVAIPTILGVALGRWLDERFPVTFSWTLTLLLTGLLVGCLNAWYWLSRQNEAASGGSQSGDNADAGNADTKDDARGR